MNFCRVFHDNSGSTNKKASWFLKSVSVHDLQKREKFYFICQRWFAVDKDDGLIDRGLPVAGEAQQTELKYLLSKQTKDKLSDGHLWFSILARPTLSTFSRLDRLTCCFVLLFITMLANIIYYDIDKQPKTEGLQIGPFSLTQQQVHIPFLLSSLKL